MTKSAAIWVSILSWVLPLVAQANLGVETLPEGVRSPAVRWGTISQLDQKYTSNGRLAQTVDLHSIQFNAQRLQVIDARMQEVVGLFNRMGRYDLGSKIDKGTLKIDSKPQIQYTGLIFGQGISDRWTVGGGIPVIQYKNKIRVSQTSSNLSFYKEQAAALGEGELVSGLNQLDRIDLVQAFFSELEKKGYKTVEDQNQTFLGDLQFSSLYRFDDVRDLSSLFRVNFNLPTGPAYDADNLAALNQFGYTFIEPQILGAFPRESFFKMTGLLGFRFYVPDQINARVPRDENDLLPDISQKEKVRRQVGAKWTEALQASVDVGESLTLFGISEWSQKSKDRYDGSEGRRYELLGQDSDTEAQVVTAGFTYSSVKSYQKRKKGIPTIVSLQASDTIAGRNVERQMVQEFSATLFF